MRTYFEGMLESTSLKKVQYFCTELIDALSSGEWAPLMVGPKLTISIPGLRSPKIPHSRPACIAATLASSPLLSLL